MRLILARNFGKVAKVEREIFVAFVLFPQSSLRLRIISAPQTSNG